MRHCRRPARVVRRFPSLLVPLVASVAVLVLSACGSEDGSDDGQAEAGVTDGGTTGSTSSGSGDGQGTGEGAEGTPEGFFSGSITVVVPNSPGTISTSGPQRVMTALLGEGPNAYLGGPEQAVTVRYSAVDDEIVGEVAGSWLTTEASSLGLYVAPYAFERAGLWEVVVLADGREVGETLIEVVEESPVPTIGEAPPPSPTPTGSTVAEVAAISTDPEPDLSLYDLSLDEALTNGRPTVVAFATPAFCQTALCGPTLEIVKAAAAGRDDIDVVHVEPFDLELAPQGILEPIPIMFDWGLVTEPWVFVVDADGLVAASFEGIIGQDELQAALDRL